MPRNKKAKRPRGLKPKLCRTKSNEPTNKELMPWFIRYGQWMAMNVAEKQEQYPGKHKGRCQFEKKIVEFSIVKGTDREFAKLAGVTVETLCQWMHRPELWEIRNQYLNLSMRRLTGPVIRGLALNAMKHGQPHAVREFINYAEGGGMGPLKPTGKAHEPLGEAAKGMLARYDDKKEKKAV